MLSGAHMAAEFDMKKLTRRFCCRSDASEMTRRVPSAGNSNEIERH
jgi:hypothetical protein